MGNDILDACTALIGLSVVVGVVAMWIFILIDSSNPDSRKIINQKPFELKGKIYKCSEVEL